jgi:hypothetical protein
LLFLEMSEAAATAAAVLFGQVVVARLWNETETLGDCLLKQRFQKTEAPICVRKW